MGNLLNMSGGALIKKKGLLPSGYVQLEYIENTSNAYIDTGIIPTVDTDTDITFQYTALPTSASMSMGCQQWSGFDADNETYYVVNMARQSTKTFNCRVFNDVWVNSNISCDTAKHTVKYRFIDNNNRELSLDDNTYPITAIGDLNKQLRVDYFLFALNNVNSLSHLVNPDLFSKCKIFSFSQKRNSTDIINLIPCINHNNEVGMYDLVTQSFFKSPNGTAFIAGPEV